MPGPLQLYRDNMKSPISTIFLSLILLCFGRAQAADELLPAKKLLVFYAPSCHKCMEIKAKVLPQLMREYAGRLEIEERDISDVENYKLLLGLREKYDRRLGLVVPVIFSDGRFLTGKKVNIENLRWLIAGSGVAAAGVKVPAVYLVQHFRSFSPLAVAAAGLIDGVNPCAFTVIVFFISYLALQGYKRRELVAVGLTFIAAVFLTYLLLGLGIFNFLYYLKGFWAVAKAANIAIGIFSLGLGCVAVYDFFKFKKSGSSDGLVLQLPQGIKNRIHQVIGLHYRKGPAESAVSVSLLPKLIGSAFVCGFVVTLLEAVCTGQTYLPTIAFILKTTPLKLQAAASLALYNIMFIAPLSVIFIFALTGVSSADFSQFLKKHMFLLKALMAALFFGLGIFLLWRYSG